MSKVLYCHNLEELGDLGNWAADHPQGWDEQPLLYAWLDDVFGEGHVLPHRFPVPQHLVEVLEALIEDWCEVLTANGEQFHSRLEDA